MSTFAGFMAVVFWSLSIPISRSLTEKLGIFHTAGLACLIGGVLQMLYYLITSRSQFRSILAFSPKHFLSCGLTFIPYIISLYVAIGMAANRQQIVEVSLINYLWPTLILVFSIPILKNKASPWLIPGIIVSISGIVIASVSMNRSGFDLEIMASNFRNNAVPYVFALAAAVLWSVYSNLAKLYADLSTKMAVPLFLVISGILLESLSFCFHEKSTWSGQAISELAVLSIFPCVLAYAFWDLSMRKGNMILVTSFSYLTPLFSIMVTGIYLGVKLDFGVWIACALVISGAVICNFSMRRKG